jgi:hypothetical protein
VIPKLCSWDEPAEAGGSLTYLCLLLQISINVPSIATEMFFIYYSLIHHNMFQPTPSSGGTYISHFFRVLSVLQLICCFCDFVVVYACIANYSILIYSFSYDVTQPLTEMNIRNIKIIMFLGSKVRWLRRADNLAAICEPIV